MIPKIIHYCWFGQKKPPRFICKNIREWGRLHPNYEILCWDESNSSFDDNLYVKQAYQMGKWAFVSDYIRLKVITEYGGVYLDTDVKLLCPLDRLLNDMAFLGFESLTKVATCVMGAVPQHSLFKSFLGFYQGKRFLDENGKTDETTNVIHLTELLSHRGLQLNGEFQMIDDIKIYPSTLFSPIDLETGKMKITSDTVAIHYFRGSWMSLSQRQRRKVAQLLGPAYTAKIKKIMGIRED